MMKQIQFLFVLFLHKKASIFDLILYRRIFFILYVFVVSVYPLSERFFFPRFPVQSLLFMPKSLIFTLKSPGTLVSMHGTARCAQWGGSLGWLGGVLGLMRVLAGHAV